MSLGNKAGKNREFGRIFLKGAIYLSMAILIGMGMMYYLVKNMITEQNVNMSMQAFSWVLEDFEEANGTANVLATQVLLDNVCSQMVNARSGEKIDSITLNRIRNQLSLYQYTNPAVDSIYIYNELQDLILTSGDRFGAVGKIDFHDQNIVPILSNPENYNTHNLICRDKIDRHPNGEEKAEKVYSYVLFSEQGKGSGAVVINMKAESLTRDILNMDIMEDSYLLIVNDSGNRLVDIRTCPIEGTQKLWEIVREMESGKEKYRDVIVGKERYFISFLVAEKSKWNYIKITKWDSMFGALKRLRQWTTGILVVIIIVVVVIVLANSISALRLHNLMEKKYRLSAPHIDVWQQKETFFNDFLHSRKLFRKEQLRVEMGKYGLPVSEESKYILLILRIENYSQFLEIYDKEGSYSIKFGFQNIFEEIYGRHFKIAGLLNRDDTLTFIVQVLETKFFWQELESCFKNFCENIGQFFQWDFFCMGTKQAVNLEKLPELDVKMRDYLQESFFYSAGSFLAYEDMKSAHSRQVAFQQLKLDSLKEAIQGGHGMKTAYRKLVENLEGCSMSEYMQVMVWIGITVLRSANCYLAEGIDANRFLIRLTGCTKAWMVDGLFDELFTDISERRERNGEKAGMAGRMDEVRKFVEQNYADPNITLKSLGEEFGVSPNYLGRLFKKDMAKSVADYINEERLKKVLCELERTEDSAKEIAERNGFISNNYFYTYFKKKVGLTPQAYRQMLLEKRKGRMKGEN